MSVGQRVDYGQYRASSSEWTCCRCVCKSTARSTVPNQCREFRGVLVKGAIEIARMKAREPEDWKHPIADIDALSYSLANCLYRKRAEAKHRNPRALGSLGRDPIEAIQACRS